MDNEFIPVIWPEDKASADALSYEQCEVCTPRSRIIWGEGNPKASIIIILDNPGEREDNQGQEYVCGTRQTLQKALYQVNLTWEDVYITYLLKCRPLKKYDKELARSFSKPYLIQQINTIQPRFLVCLGDTVVQTMFCDREEHVKNLRGSWHLIMGYQTIVSYHPLAVRRRPNLVPQFMQDWEMLSQRILKEEMLAKSVLKEPVF